MGRASPSIVKKLLRAVDSNRFAAPTYWSVLARYPPAQLSKKHPSPPAVRYSDANLYRELYSKHPQVRLQPMRINSTTPALASRYVALQMEAMAGGASSQEAAQQAAAALAGELHGQQRGGLVEMVQSAEEEVLVDAYVAALRGHHLPAQQQAPSNASSSPAGSSSSRSRGSSHGLLDVD